MKRRQISPERKGLYYLGMGLMIVGFLCFLSVFVTGIMNSGNFSNFDGQMKSFGIRALTGIGLIVGGRFLMSMGARGLAGSGVMLDPEKAREDVEPWSRMAGGMVKDALDETGIGLSGKSVDDKLSFDEKLRRLHKLHEDGILTKEEYDKEKADILEKN